MIDQIKPRYLKSIFNGIKAYFILRGYIHQFRSISIGLLPCLVVRASQLPEEQISVGLHKAVVPEQDPVLPRYLGYPVVHQLSNLFQMAFAGLHHSWVDVHGLEGREEELAAGCL